MLWLSTSEQKIQWFYERESIMELFDESDGEKKSVDIYILNLISANRFFSK